MRMAFDPRMQQNSAGIDLGAREELAKLKKFVADRVGTDIQMLSKAIEDLNRGVEEAVGVLNARLIAVERLLAGVSGGTLEAPPGEVLEAAGAQPGDENLPPEYFQGADDEGAI